MKTRKPRVRRRKFPPVLMRHWGFVVNKAAQLVREAFEDSLRPMGIGARHYGTLLLIATDGPCSQHAIGERIACDRTTMVGIVDDLERLRLAERRADPLDRRAYAVHPTEAGRKVLARAQRAALNAEEEFLKPLSGAERKQLQALLARLLP